MNNAFNKVSLIYNVTGQEVEFYPPAAELILEGIPTAAASYSVWKGTASNDDTAEFSGTATLDSVDTAVQGSAGYSQSNRRRVYLSSVSNIVTGRSYMLDNNEKQREIITPARVTTSGVFNEIDLSFDYASGANTTFKGIRHYFTIDATFIADKTKINVYGSVNRLRTTNMALYSAADTEAPPYRVRWSYSIGGLTRHYWTYFDVVRQPARHSVDVDSLRELFPDIAANEWNEQRGEYFRKQIDAGFDLVKFDVRAAGYDIDAIREGPMLDELVRRAAIFVCAEAGICPGNRNPEQWVIDTRQAYRNMFDRAIGSILHVWMDTGSTGAITPKPASQMWLKR